MRLLFACHTRSEATLAQYRRLVSAAPDGLDVRLFSTAVEKAGRLSWPDLDARWKRRDPALLRMHEALVRAAEGCDALLHYNGINIHPDILGSLPTFNVYCCFDDPESSAGVSAPVAAAFDAAFYGNIASGPQYAAWGCRQIAHLPILVFPGDVPEPGEREGLLGTKRDVDVLLCCGYSRWRRRRLDRLREAFPAARCHGSGWPEGRIDDATLRASILGHASAGTSTTPPAPSTSGSVLAAWGIMPLCDNRTGLDRLFEVGREAVGFDTIPEAIDLTRHYLAHEDERRAIAGRACERFWSEYAAPAGWSRIHRQISEWIASGACRESGLSAHPRRAAHGNPQPSRGRVGRTAERLRIAVDRLRYGHAVTDHDERLYTGETVPYAPGRPARSAKLAHGTVDAGDPADTHHRTALQWALASFLGPARTIIVSGDDASDFATLIRSGSARVIVIDDDVARTDLFVSTGIRHDDRLDHRLDEATARASRALLAVTLPPDAPAEACDDLHACLARRFPHVTLAFMPDPHVPWLEPLDGRAVVSPIVAACRRCRES